jgi:hypothetical protein
MNPTELPYRTHLKQIEQALDKEVLVVKNL